MGNPAAVKLTLDIGMELNVASGRSDLLLLTTPPQLSWPLDIGIESNVASGRSDLLHYGLEAVVKLQDWVPASAVPSVDVMLGDRVAV